MYSGIKDSIASLEEAEIVINRDIESKLNSHKEIMKQIANLQKRAQQIESESKTLKAALKTIPGILQADKKYQSMLMIDKRIREQKAIKVYIQSSLDESSGSDETSGSDEASGSDEEIPEHGPRGLGAGPKVTQQVLCFNGKLGFKHPAPKKTLPVTLIQDILDIAGEGHLLWLLSKRLRDNGSVRREVVVPITRLSLRCLNSKMLQFMTYNCLFKDAPFQLSNLVSVNLQEDGHDNYFEPTYLKVQFTFETRVKGDKIKFRFFNHDLDMEFERNSSGFFIKYEDLIDTDVSGIERYAEKVLKSMVSYNCRSLSPEKYNGFRCFVFDGADDTDWEDNIRTKECELSDGIIPPFSVFNAKAFRYFTNNNIKIRFKNYDLVSASVSIRSPIQNVLLGTSRNCLQDPLTTRVFAQGCPLTEVSLELTKDISINIREGDCKSKCLDYRVFTHAIDGDIELPVIPCQYTYLKLSPRKKAPAKLCYKCKKTKGVSTYDPILYHICPTCLITNLKEYGSECSIILLASE